VLSAAGGRVTTRDGAPFLYRKPGFENPLHRAAPDRAARETSGHAVLSAAERRVTARNGVAVSLSQAGFQDPAFARGA
jgi:hypothetical protein